MVFHYQEGLFLFTFPDQNKPGHIMTISLRTVNSQVELNVVMAVSQSAELSLLSCLAVLTGHFIALILSETKNPFELNKNQFLFFITEP